MQCNTFPVLIRRALNTEVFMPTVRNLGSLLAAIGNDLVEYVCEHASRRLAKYDSGGLAWLGLRSSRQAASTVRPWRGIRTRYTISRTPAIVLKASTSVSAERKIA